MTVISDIIAWRGCPSRCAWCLSNGKRCFSRRGGLSITCDGSREWLVVFLISDKYSYAWSVCACHRPEITDPDGAWFLFNDSTRKQGWYVMLPQVRRDVETVLHVEIAMHVMHSLTAAAP